MLYIIKEELIVNGRVILNILYSLIKQIIIYFYSKGITFHLGNFTLKNVLHGLICLQKVWLLGMSQ